MGVTVFPWEALAVWQKGLCVISTPVPSSAPNRSASAAGAKASNVAANNPDKFLLLAIFIDSLLRFFVAQT